MKSLLRQVFIDDMRGNFQSDEIDEVDNHCHLGITFQLTVTWKKHIDDMYKKACSRLFWLGQVKHLLDRYSLIRICVAFIIL
jgi:hypothetical protein